LLNQKLGLKNLQLDLKIKSLKGKVKILTFENIKIS